MKNDMLAARHLGPGDLQLQPLPRPSAKPGWVVVEPKAVGICGTDTHIHAGEFPARPPVTLGHEIAGVIVEVGDGIDDLAVDDRVCIEPHIFCTTCRYCRGGRENLCTDKLAFGVHLDGGMAEAVTVPRRTVYRIPDAVSMQIAALAEPLACSIHGVERLSPRQGEPLAIVGAGPAGLINTALAVRAGAAPIVVVEPNPSRRDLARTFGADVVLDPAEPEWQQDALAITGGYGFDAVIEAVGGGPTLESAVGLAAPGARVLVFGAAPAQATATLRPYEIFAKELTLLGTVINPYTQARAMRLLDRLPLDQMPIETVRLDEVGAAFNGSLDHATKVQIAPA